MTVTCWRNADILDAAAADWARSVGVSWVCKESLMAQESRKALLESRANRPNKFELRRQELAAATLSALGEFGYANTSLRDIAAASGCSLGTLHYYFVDKADLIAFCVRGYKRHFIAAANSISAAATTTESLVETFVDFFVNTMKEEAESHRLWYDIRSQAYFDAQFQETVTEIEGELFAMVAAFIERAAELSGTTPSISTEQAKWTMDGMFQHYLSGHLMGVEGNDREYRRQLTSFLMGLLPTG